MSTSVAAVVVTFNRADVLDGAIQALHGQTTLPHEIFVIDNASTDETQERFESRTDVTYLRAPDNGGYASGLAIGIDAARAAGHGAFWLLDDDSAPMPSALGALLEVVAAAGPTLGLVGLRGGMLRHGDVEHLRSAGALADRREVVPGAREVEFSLVDGALLLDPAALIAGPPDRRWFMMFEDIELSWRIRRAGFQVVVLEHELIERGHLGSSGTGQRNPWRRYYLARNQLRWAIETRDIRALLGTSLRFLRITASDVRGRRWAAPMASTVGFRDAVANRMGPTVPPGEFRYDYRKHRAHRPPNGPADQSPATSST